MSESRPHPAGQGVLFSRRPLAPRRALLPGGARGQVVGVPGAGIHLPLLARTVDELSVEDDRLRAVLGVARAGMHEPEAPAGLHRKRLPHSGPWDRGTR